MNNVLKDLLIFQDLGYKKFNSKSVPNVDENKIIGIRIPIIRKYAKKLVKEQAYEDFLNELPHYYLEENLLHMSILSEIKDIDYLIKELDKFLPYIDNWEVCDFNFKLFKNYPEKIHQKVEEWINSNETYKVRFGLVTLLNNYLDYNFNENDIHLVCGIKNEDYYVKMAISWYLSYGLIKQYNIFVKLFVDKKLDKWIHNKSIQKAIESLRVNREKKYYLKTIKMI